MLTGSVGRTAVAGLFPMPVCGALLAAILLAAPASSGRAADAVEAADPAPAPGMAWAQAHAEVRRVVEELRSEIEAMKRVAAAQKELMAWNEERARLGLAAMSLRPELCREEEIEKWCRLLPATFGVSEDDLR